MIGIIFDNAGEIVEARINGHQILFRTSTFGSSFVPFESLHLNKEGVVKEFPDLEGDDLWKQKATERFKDKIKSLGNENNIANYIIEDLSKHGYVAKYKQRQGYRVEVINAD